MNQAIRRGRGNTHLYASPGRVITGRCRAVLFTLSGRRAKREVNSQDLDTMWNPSGKTAGAHTLLTRSTPVYTCLLAPPHLGHLSLLPRLTSDSSNPLTPALSLDADTCSSYLFSLLQQVHLISSDASLLSLLNLVHLLMPNYTCSPVPRYLAHPTLFLSFVALTCSPLTPLLCLLHLLHLIFSNPFSAALLNSAQLIDFPSLAAHARFQRPFFPATSPASPPLPFPYLVLVSCLSLASTSPESSVPSFILCVNQSLSRL